MKQVIRRIGLCLVLSLFFASVVHAAPLDTALDQGRVTEAVPLIEQTWEKQYEDYFRVNFPDPTITAADVAETLGQLATQTGKKPALIYVVPRAKQLELVLITPGQPSVQKRVAAAPASVLLPKVKQFSLAIADPRLKPSNQYLPAAQQLYEWMIAPLEAELAAQKIDTLIFCLGVGLRTLPLSALHDGQQFLVEKYSLSRIPAFTLTDTLYSDIRRAPVLAMGASSFKEHIPLPSVPVELFLVARNTKSRRFFLNQDFTLANLQRQRTSQAFKIIHLATHADFQPGSPRHSYIQLWDDKLQLNEMQQLRWQKPPVDLLVLSACKTAIGDRNAELGFAGLAVQAGVKSAIASLWYVSDRGTLSLMSEFYRQLQTAPIKAEALRQVQISLLQKQVRIENGQLRSSRGPFSLPPELAGQNEDLSHPYYWAAFTVVGSPW
ncbi:CHAT domain-containing protein [Trichocoleus sp. FACHB-591]|uniref:CHAT domain-containing protein n=1 Tax=Trichocoleus sp. FACHB-591 TaxID=2692872 RepID=UPI00168349AB|nr:CHAT domain-containing protein [Trichocoleus sp. FACHB-591]MBD2096878.1 CHAT domain-containing protein [Trichocoleus sp. FACHB-591]